jgi:hypothetical protein
MLLQNMMLAILGIIQSGPAMSTTTNQERHYQLIASSQDISCSPVHDGCVRELVHALPTFWVPLTHQNLVAVFFDHTVERLVGQPVVPWR